MGKSKIIGMKPFLKATKKDLFQFWATEQTRLLVEYAESRMVKIGSKLMGFDGNGNLLDSLCWAVYFNGKMESFGYYRASEAIEDTYLHALSKSRRKPINGRAEAEKFLAEYSPQQSKGWEVIWAVLAPYWGYWEEGHNNILMKQTVKFSIMCQQYRTIQKELKPSKVSYRTYVPTY